MVTNVERLPKMCVKENELQNFAAFVYPHPTDAVPIEIASHSEQGFINQTLQNKMGNFRATHGVLALSSGAMMLWRALREPWCFCALL